MVKISNTFFNQKKQGAVECPYCVYVVAKPYPKDQLCPKCRKFLAVIFDLTSDKDEKPIPKEFKTKTDWRSSKERALVPALSSFLGSTKTINTVFERIATYEYVKQDQVNPHHQQSSLAESQEDS